MTQVKSTVIVPLAFYCFVLGFLSFSMAVNSICNSIITAPNPSFALWIPVIAAFILACGIFAVGVGILYLRQVCWRILFFGLAICVACVTSALIVYLFLLMLNASVIAQIFQSVQITAVTMFSFFAFFLSEIIVLYYLTRAEVIECFGGTGFMTSPF